MDRTAAAEPVPVVVRHARPRVARLGVAAGYSSALCTATSIAVVWAAAVYETDVDPSSWAYVGAYILTVCATPLVVLTLLGATMARRSGTVGEVGTILAMAIAGLTSAIGLWLAQLLLDDASTSTSLGPGWGVAFAGSFAVAAVLPWVLVAYRAMRD